MRDREIDEILHRAALATLEPDEALLNRVAKSITASLRPVRPTAPLCLLVFGLILICAAIALADSARLGFDGFERLSSLNRVLIFSTLGVFIWLAATEFVSSMVPGSRRRISPSALLAASCFVLLAVFASVFHNYHTHHFVYLGFICLLNGLLHAAPAGVASWWLLRRGFAVNSVAAGLAGGLLGGLAGAALLELHCANFEALHVMLWHTAVIPISAFAGGVMGWATQVRRRAQAV